MVFGHTHFISDTSELSAESSDLVFNCKPNVLMELSHHLLLLDINDDNWQLDRFVELNIGLVLLTVALEIIHA